MAINEHNAENFSGNQNDDRSNTITTLPTQFQGRGEVKGYIFTQVRKTDKALLYKVSSGDREHYEVLKRIINTRFACESYPTSKAFGIWAWTCMTLEAALNKFAELNGCD